MHNGSEQDPWRVKPRVRPMGEFPCVAHATITISGIALVLRIKKEPCAIVARCIPHARTPREGSADCLTITLRNLALLFTLQLARPPTQEHAENGAHDVQSWSGAAPFGTLLHANIRVKEVAMKRLPRRTVFISLVVVVLTLKTAVPEELPAWGWAPLSGEEPPSSAGYAQREGKSLREDEEGAQLPVLYAQWGTGGQRTVRCESQSDRYAYCPTYTNGRVQLQQQLSNARCQPYDTWGTDGDGSGIWVRNGCRAIFVVSGGWGGGGWGGGGDGSGRTITCKSEGFRYNRCPAYVGRRRVNLSRQLSDTSCVRGSSWGVDRDGIWVNDGCAAEFTIR